MTKGVINVSYKININVSYKINYLKLCSMIGLMIKSNDFHSPRSFEYTSPILNLQAGQARQWGLLVRLKKLMLL